MTEETPIEVVDLPAVEKPKKEKPTKKPAKVGYYTDTTKLIDGTWYYKFKVYPEPFRGAKETTKTGNILFSK